MKSTIFSRLTVSILLAAVSVAEAVACGPYPPIIPTPEFLGLSRPHKTMADYDRNENLLLWQSLTSDRIPLADIDEAVYHDSLNEFYDHLGFSPEKTDNLFYIYLSNTNDSEIIDFLGTAKILEEQWRNTRSPWYYPSSRDAGDNADDDGSFSEIIEQCKDYNGTRLRDRYALQAARALFASRRYPACIEFYDSAFSDIPDDNLMKRMAQRYVAGCWSRLGEKERADSIFAEAGDIWSISLKNPVDFMAQMNPDAPQLMEYIRSNVADTAFMREVVPVAQRLLNDSRVKNKGDWDFLLAYIGNEINHNLPDARRHISEAMRKPFSSGEIKDLAHAYRIKLDAQSGNMHSLLSDLEWMEGKADPLDTEASEWIRRCRNIIYADWVPQLWRKKDYSTAILLCAYADNLVPSAQWQEAWDASCGYGQPSRSLSMEQLRDSETYRNNLDYGCLSFQMMGSLSSSQLASAYNRIISDNPLYGFLRRKARTDRDYYYELTGTLALREENYARAADYLSKVSDRYLNSMNICKEGYLADDPFHPYESLMALLPPGDRSHTPEAHNPGLNPGAKLDFARKMQAYKQKMLHSRDADERGLSQLMYAIGRRNSFEDCWALTQYWRGVTDKFEPDLQYWDDDFGADNYSFLYDYLRTVGQNATDERYRNDIESALAMLSSDEAKAKANYILGNLATIVRDYGTTATAQYVRTSCDNWRSWL